MNEELKRYEELKTKGWVNLKAEERQEFQDLKSKYPTLPDEKADSPKTPKRTNKEILDSFKKVSFIIPLADHEQPGAFDTVQISCDGSSEKGHKYIIKKGERVEIPEPVADLLAAKYRINMSAGQSSRSDRNTEVQNALS